MGVGRRCGNTANTGHWRARQAEEMCRCVPLHMELKDSYDDKEGVKGSGDIETIH